jgi:general secretion pathway protein A
MYTDRYGFSGQPFQLTPDARFFFGSRTHKKALAYLGYGLAQGEGFIVITGEVGAGKSTLVAHLMATIDRARLNAIQIVSTQVEGDDMLRLTAQGLGLHVGGVEKARLLEAVEQKLEEAHRAGKRTLLIVDEAQNLPVSALEELRMLSNYQVGGRALLQIFLLGQPEFRDKLSGAERLEQLRQRVIATHHLGPMEADEVGAYILHRLQQVGWDGRPGFEPEAFAAIHRHTDGIPRRVNQLANRLMLQSAVEGLDRIDAAAVEAVVADMAADQPEPGRERAVLPFRFPRHGKAAPAPAPQAEAQFHPQPVDPAYERQLAELETRLAEQEAALRRVLTLLIDWVENGERAPDIRTHAA